MPSVVNSAGLGGGTLKPPGGNYGYKFPCSRCGKVRELQRIPEGPNYCKTCKPPRGEKRTPERYRRCLECQLVNRPGAIKYHQKQTGHVGWEIVAEP